MLITSDLTMTFLLRTLRDWFDKLEAIALQNPALLQNKTERSYVVLFTDKTKSSKVLSFTMLLNSLYEVTFVSFFW